MIRSRCIQNSAAPRALWIPSVRSPMNSVPSRSRQYHNMYVSNKITKKSMCDLVIPFKEKYGLTDHEALNIVKGFTSTKKIMNILKTVFP